MVILLEMKGGGYPGNIRSDVSSHSVFTEKVRLLEFVICPFRVRGHRGLARAVISAPRDRVYSDVYICYAHIYQWESMNLFLLRLNTWLSLVVLISLDN